MAELLEVDIKRVSTTTEGASNGKQLVTLTFECDESINIMENLQEDEKTGIEIPSHAPHG